MNGGGKVRQLGPFISSETMTQQSKSAASAVTVSAPGSQRSITATALLHKQNETCVNGGCAWAGVTLASVNHLSLNPEQGSASCQ
jgi:hypothetical protein